MTPLRVIIGLGNPGEKYVGTRHNVGFEVLDGLAHRLGITFRLDRKWEGEIAHHPDFLLLKPLTYMNESGRSAASLCRFYRWSPSMALVVYDDVNLSLGRLRFRERGSHGGHNGMKSLIEHFGTQDFPRLRVGIGAQKGQNMVGHVLGKFAMEERELAKNTLATAVDALQAALSGGLNMAANEYNGAPDVPQKPPDSTSPL